MTPPGAPRRVQQRDNISLWCYGTTGAGWAVFDDSKPEEKQLVINGRFETVWNKWCELTI